MDELKDCDLIMKGGVTSGVVYPSAILKLKDHYRFRGIGGASAGAIAAAATAAAEYGRQTTNSEKAGFRRLDEVKEKILGSGFVKSLFQPADKLASLYHLLLDLKALFPPRDESEAEKEPLADEPPKPILQRLQGWYRLADTVVGHAEDLVKKHALAGYERGERVGTLASVVSAFILAVPLLVVPLWYASVTLKLVGVVLFLSILGFMAGPLTRIARVVGGLVELTGGIRHLMSPESLFGMCPGSCGPNSKDSANHLTDWLSVTINTLAGLPPTGDPLTIADLQMKGIEFRMVTTNLSHGQPYTLPMDDASYLFKVEEFERLFPRNVVEYLKNPPTPVRRWSYELPHGYCAFPKGELLPVIVATRMSLSFPILLCAVPLYTVKSEAFKRVREGGRALEAGDLERCWFSDGGIASNFPIHFFDDWMPEWPTFGISLGDSPIGQFKRPPENTPANEVSGDIFLPLPKDTHLVRPKVRPIGGIVPFLTAILDTARASRDNMQSALPSYRERVVTVYLDQNEGGLNLDMPEKVIKRIVAKGKLAGDAMIERFNFRQHQWVRWLLLMGKIEQELFKIRDRGTNAPGERNEDWKVDRRSEMSALFAEQLRAGARVETAWYRKQEQDWCTEAAQRMDDFFGLIEKWNKRQQAWAKRHPDAAAPRYFFAGDMPLPEPILRVTPPF